MDFSEPWLPPINRTVQDYPLYDSHTWSDLPPQNERLTTQRNQLNQVPPLSWDSQWPSRNLGESVAQATLAPVPPLPGGMVSVGPPSDQNPMEVESSRPTGQRRRKHIYSEDQWKQHIPQIKRLYIDEKKTLQQTRKIMAQNHSFMPSVRVYKNKFDELGWTKKLATSTASFILSKQQERLETSGKLTDFVLFDQPISIDRAEDTIRRNRRGPNLQSAPRATPTGLVYSTPQTHTASSLSPHVPSALNGPRSTQDLGYGSPFPGHLPLVWDGYSVSDIAAIVADGKALEAAGDIDIAEKKYREALAGYEHLLSPTHQESLDVGYMLADLLAKRNLHHRADEVLDRINRNVVSHWGHLHNRSSQHFVRVIELYRGWSRNTDAATLTSVLLEAIEQSCFISTSNIGRNEQLPSMKTILEPNFCFSNRSGETSAITEIRRMGSDSRRIVGNSQPPTYGKVAIVNLIRCCQQELPKQSKEVLKATRLLIRLIQVSTEREEISELCSEVNRSCNLILNYCQEEDGVLDATLNIAESLVQVGDEDSLRWSKNLMECIVHHAERLYGDNNAVVITMLVKIGSIYYINIDKSDKWREVRPWLEMALSASISSHYKHKAPIDASDIKALESSLENQSIGGLRKQLRGSETFLARMVQSI